MGEATLGLDVPDILALLIDLPSAPPTFQNGTFDNFTKRNNNDDTSQCKKLCKNITSYSVSYCIRIIIEEQYRNCLLYTSDAADE